MAGAGYKLFNTGDVLTATDVNTYLQEQVVMVFASASARTTALSGVLAEGMLSYLKDTDAVEKYTGSAWTSISGGTTPQTFTLLNAGGTALTGSATITVSSLSGYNQLYVTWDGASSATSAATITLRFNSDSGSNYRRSGMWFGWGAANAVTGNGGSSTGATSLIAGQTASDAATDGAGGFHIFGTNSTGIKPYIGWGTGLATGGEAWLSSGHYAGTSVISSVSIISSGGNFDAGTIYVYGA